MPVEGCSSPQTANSRSAQLNELLSGSIPQLLAFLDEADVERNSHRLGSQTSSTEDRSSALVDSLSSSREQLESILKGNGFLNIDRQGSGSSGVQGLLNPLLQYSVNTSAPGFLDKLYAAPLPPGILAELVLAILNTNVHVYQVSPVLTLVEKHLTRSLADMFGLTGPRKGGISVQGGSASNMTSIVVARNTLFPETKTKGNGAVKGRLVLFTSAHGHYSIEKAAQAIGLGSGSAVAVPVDASGRMMPSELDRLITQHKYAGDVPFYVNATAGSTVLGSFDPFEDIHRVVKRHGLWLHVDAAWGGGFIFSRRFDLQGRLHGIGLADSISTNPHKMLGMPMTCSFLLAKDLRQFQEANTLRAGYLFHDNDDADKGVGAELRKVQEQEKHQIANNLGPNEETGNSRNVLFMANGYDQDGLLSNSWEEPYDLADLTLQCGRRGDSLKFLFSLKYYGLDGYAAMVDNAYELACHACHLIAHHPDLQLVLPAINLSCLQVCFYFTPGGKFVYGLCGQSGILQFERSQNDTQAIVAAHLGKLNSRITSNIAKSLVRRGFMIDFAPALEGQEDRGTFFRVVVNISTPKETVGRLIRDLVCIGNSVLAEIKLEAEARGTGPR